MRSKKLTLKKDDHYSELRDFHRIYDTEEKKIKPKCKHLTRESILPITKALRPAKRNQQRSYIIFFVC